jgi:hypothetical protein
MALLLGNVLSARQSMDKENFTSVVWMITISLALLTGFVAAYYRG